MDETKKKKNSHVKHIRSARKGLIGAFAVLTTFVLALILLSTNVNVSNLSPQTISPTWTGYASSGLYIVHYTNGLGITVVQSEFEANWTYYGENGTYMQGYAPYWHANAPLWGSSVKLESPQWAQIAPGNETAYGDGYYIAGMGWFSITQGFYSAYNIPPNSYGTGTFSWGCGTVNY
ncbi:MAG: hypothetical protein ACP5NL_00080 [Thermoplasmata archaeon]